jgi:hypothetical protein
LAWIKEKERRAQVEGRSKKTYFVHFLMKYKEVLKVLEILIAYLMKGMFLFTITFD